MKFIGASFGACCYFVFDREGLAGCDGYGIDVKLTNRVHKLESKIEAEY